MPIEHDLIPVDPTRPWVRVTVFEGPAENVRQALDLALEHLLPGLRGRPGWQGTVGLASDDGRRGLTLTFWESRDALDQSGAGASSIRQGASAAGVTVAGLDHYEVVFHETPDSDVE